MCFVVCIFYLRIMVLTFEHFHDVVGINYRLTKRCDFKEYGGVYKMPAAAEKEQKDEHHYTMIMDKQHVPLLGKTLLVYLCAYI